MLSIIPAQYVKFQFGGESPLTMRARCGGCRYCPSPLGNVTTIVGSLDRILGPLPEGSEAF